MVGMHALGKQLSAMGLNQSTSLESGSPMALIFMDMFTQLGDDLAKQYGGSETNKRVASDGAETTQQVSCRYWVLFILSAVGLIAQYCPLSPLLVARLVLH